jgi:predicted ATPase
VGQFASVRLFVDRAFLSRPDFRLTRENSASVAAICRRLDGLPLALELAASRVRGLTPAEIVQRLDQGLRVLTNRDAPVPRHTTIDAMLDWSHELLSGAERTLLQRLSVFRGGWTLPAAEHVCADVVDESPVPELPRDVRGLPARSIQTPEAASIDGEEIVDLMTDLVRRSLVRLDPPGPGGGGGRYRLLEVVRQFAWEKLRASGMEEPLQRRHTRYFLLFAVEAERRLLGPDAAEWHARLTRDHDNLHAALAAAARDRADVESGMRLAHSLGRYWANAGLFSMGIAQITQQIDREEGQGSSWYRAAILTWAGIMCYETGRYPEAIRFHQASCAIMEERGDRHGVATSMAGLGDVLFRTGDHDRARKHYENNVATMKEIGDPARLGMALNKLAIFFLESGDPARARELQEEHLAVQRSCESVEGIATALSNLSIVLIRLNETGRAMECATEALSIRRRIGDKAYMTTTLNQIARIHVIEGRVDRALPLLREALQIHLESPRPASVIQTLELLSEHAELLGRREDSLILLSSGCAIGESAGRVLHASERTALEAKIEHLRSLAGEHAADRAWISGQAMTLMDALHNAGAYVDRASSPNSGSG